jgi:cytochrome oxidase Cu insertion factor (SCO1/SenC/PrrC family)
MLVSVLLGAGGASTESQQSRQQPAAAAPDVTRLGPQVGAKVPNFTLPDQTGRRRSLSSLMGEKGLVLVFNRSADW